MTRPIGYYVHHHGAGHRARALAIADAAQGRVTLLGTGLAGATGDHPAVDLPDDRMAAAFDGADAAETRPEALHYAPIDHDGVRRRVAAIAAWIATERPALIVVDISCEIAMLARLASVPTIVVRLGGLRDDAPHRQAFGAASLLIAPFAAALDHPDTPDWIVRKTRYCPGLVPRVAERRVEPKTILVVLGRGGDPIDDRIWSRAAAAAPDYRWTVIGSSASPAGAPSNLAMLGWVEDAAARIASAAIVVGSAGDGVVGAVLAARRPFVCLPEDRPFDEQRAKAARLAEAGAAILCADPGAADWAALIAQAGRLDPAAAAALDDPDGPDSAARSLIALADAAGPA